MRISHLAFCGLIAASVILTIPAQAQLVGSDTAAGDSCASYPTGATRMTADANTDGLQVTLVCNGTTWEQEGLVVVSKAGGPPTADGPSAIWLSSGSGIYYSTGNVGIGAAPSSSALELQGDFGAPEAWSIALNVSDGSYGTSAAYNGTVGIYSFVENGAIGAGYTEAYSVFAEAQGTSDSKQQNVFGLGASVVTYDTDIGHAINVSDGDISTGGTIYGIYINLDDTDVTRYGIYQTTANNNYLAGNLGIGVTPTVALDVSGDIHYTGVIADVSDRRKKDNITPIENSLDGVLSLNGYSFTMKDDPDNKVEYGLIAQEVEPEFPELVITNGDGFKSLNYIGLIAPMIEAMKEQQIQIEALEAKVKRLETSLSNPNKPGEL